jgi:hypothetical protein
MANATLFAIGGMGQLRAVRFAQRKSRPKVAANDAVRAMKRK